MWLVVFNRVLLIRLSIVFGNAVATILARLYLIYYVITYSFTYLGRYSFRSIELNVHIEGRTSSLNSFLTLPTYFTLTSICISEYHHPFRPAAHDLCWWLPSLTLAFPHLA